MNAITLVRSCSKYRFATCLLTYVCHYCYYFIIITVRIIINIIVIIVIVNVVIVVIIIVIIMIIIIIIIVLSLSLLSSPFSYKFTHPSLCFNGAGSISLMMLVIFYHLKIVCGRDYIFMCLMLIPGALLSAPRVSISFYMGSAADFGVSKCAVILDNRKPQPKGKGIPYGILIF